MNTGKFSANVTTDSDSRSLLTDFRYIILIAMLGIFCLLYGYELKTLEKTLWAKINGLLFFLLFFISVITLAFISLDNSKKLNRYFFLFLTLFLLNFLATIIYIPNDDHYSVIGDKTTFSVSVIVFRNPLRHSHAITINKEHGFDRLDFEVTSRDGMKYKISLIGNHKLNLNSEEELLQIVRMAEDLNLTPNQAIGMYQRDKVVEAVKNYFLDEKAKNLRLFLEKNLKLNDWFLTHTKGSIQVLDIEEL